MSSYTMMDGWLSEIMWSAKGDRNRIVTTVKDRIPKTTLAMWNKVYEAVMPLYLEGVKGGKWQPYQMNATSKDMVREIAAKSSQSETYVKELLFTILSLKDAGEITAVMYDPRVPGEARLDVVEQAARKTAATAKKVVLGVTKTAGEGAMNLAKGTWPIIIGVAAVALIIYAPVLKKALPSKRA